MDSLLNFHAAAKTLGLFKCIHNVRLRDFCGHNMIPLPCTVKILVWYPLIVAVESMI